MAGAICSSPVYDSNRRAKNWLAVIFPEPLMPGGLGRRWMPRARGEFLYMVHTLALHDPVEFGADYVTTLGRKHPNRWFGVVVSITERSIEIEPAETALAAILRSDGLRAPAAEMVSAGA